MKYRLTSWNIREGNEDKKVDEGLKYFSTTHADDSRLPNHAIELTKMPAIIGIQEAKNYQRPLEHYIRIQHGSESYGARPETANIALYIRKDLYPLVTKVLSARMKKRWRGPKAGILHDGRVYRGVVLNGVTYWCVHVPVGDAAAARRETWAWMRRQIWKPGKVIIFGDMNIHRYGMSKALRFAWRKVVYKHNHVDGFLIKKNIKQGNFMDYVLRFGSDHEAVSVEV